MTDLFEKRMSLKTKEQSLGLHLVEDSDFLENRLFTNNLNYKKGLIYDWSMNEIDEVDYIFEKVKTFAITGTEIEYHVRFRPNYNPEFLYKNRNYLNDGKQRLGFYLDVPDYSKEIIEKWLIVGKDDKKMADRYIALKCNWCLEWVSKGSYFNAMACVREAGKSSTTVTKEVLGGTTAGSDLSVVLPSSEDVTTLDLGMRVIISDNMVHPRVLEIINIKNTASLGVTVLDLKQTMFNSHVDFCGDVNTSKNSFVFDVPILDLPKFFGGNFHMICNAIESKIDTENNNEDNEYILSATGTKLYVNGSPIIVSISNSIDIDKWHIFVDDIEYSIDDLSQYFNIQISDNELIIKSINKTLVKYIVKIAVYDQDKNFYNSVEMEVAL